jgi:hypothetical protein
LEISGAQEQLSRSELMGNPFSLESAQPFMDIYQSAMDPAVRQIDKTRHFRRKTKQERTAALEEALGFGSRLGIIESPTTGEGSRAAGDLRAGAAKEGLNFAAGRYRPDRAARQLHAKPLFRCAKMLCKAVVEDTIMALEAMMYVRC